MDSPAPQSLTDRSSEDTRAFYQERIARYLLIYGMLGASFVMLRVVSAAVTTSVWHEVTQQNFLAHVVGAASSLAGWLLVRQGHKSVDLLEAIETTSLLASMISYQLMGYFMPPLVAPDMLVMLALSMGLFARAIYVPSTARRSLTIGLAVAIPHVAIAVGAPFRVQTDPVDARVTAEFYQLYAQMLDQPLDLRIASIMSGLSAAVWWLGAIGLTTGASRVIYDLREEVRDVRRLGQYQLEEKLGEGGMGIVHRAHHAMLRRPTAVKLLPADRVGARSLARFEREVQQTARLTHPNTVTVFDYGRTPDGVFYYAMELLDGADLDTIVEAGGAQPAARVVHVLRQVCGSLAEAHGVGLIHRDIKPANIMLCERGGIPDTVKVLDFGLVKELRSDAAVSLTQADVVTGTPQYLAPEALTAPDRVDARSDLYALGAVAFLLLTGEELFGGATTVEVCSHHLHTPPRRPSELMGEAIPPDLEAAIMACLAKDPTQRPASAAALGRQLAACSCAGDWTDDDARAWWDAHPQLRG